MRSYKNICAILKSARPNNLLTAIRNHYESDKNIVSYKLDQLPAVISLKVKYQKCLSIRNFIEILCSFTAITTLVIKKTDFDAIAIFWNLDPKEAENLKFDQECSIPDTMTLKHFYMRNIYSSKDMNNEI
ncbi:178_t:CDS:2 [Funneliformis geosporum]|uniref:178_t:CDS:1 n=1 Tax=Funneliformis geosporum TaxID=1117311 RepID=A0A9W4WWN6_9GLOM|nr:178_t:CDS:2 [Funneliformis geosporum]